MKNLVIRPYRQADLAEVVELWRLCELVMPWNNPESDIRRKLEVDPDLFLVGESGGRVVASVMAGYEGHRGWVNYLAVAPSFRQAGFGRALMAEVEEKLRDRGCPKINLQVRANNSKVIHFYESAGYTVDNVVSMGKRLIED